MDDKQKYKFKFEHSLIEELGIKLYSNLTATISELIANSYDADATRVDISVDHAENIITIIDDGIGMSLDDINNKYLSIGYKKREHGEAISVKYGRAVMGRKGIGKLSVFSIADDVEIYSKIDNEFNGLRLNLKDIQQNQNKEYCPEDLDVTLFKDSFKYASGTKIVLKDLKKQVRNESLKKGIAQRFLFRENNFEVYFNDEKIGKDILGYYEKAQFLWYFENTDATQFQLEEKYKIKENKIKIGNEEHLIKGWLATGEFPKEVKSFKGIKLYARNKLSQENILDKLNIGSNNMLLNYLYGELEIEFLDSDSDEDIATSNRQGYMEDNDRFEKLKEFLEKTLQNIGSEWNDLRNGIGSEKIAKMSQELQDWLNGMKKDQKKLANKVLGAIYKALPEDGEKQEERKMLVKCGIVGFQKLLQKDTLDALNSDQINLFSNDQFLNIFRNISELEETYYYDKVQDRIKVIEALKKHVDNNLEELKIEEFIKDNFWLLDPSWEKAYMEQRVEKPRRQERIGLSIFTKENKEKYGILDIRYTNLLGEDVIIELKRPKREVTYSEVNEQVDKYRKAIESIYREENKFDQKFRFYILCKNAGDIDEKNKKSLFENANATILTYEEMINNAERQYRDYIDLSGNNKELNSILRVWESI